MFSKLGIWELQVWVVEAYQSNASIAQGKSYLGLTDYASLETALEVRVLWGSVFQALEKGGCSH